MVNEDKYKPQREYKERFKKKFGIKAFYEMNNYPYTKNYKKTHKREVNKANKKQRHRITLEVLTHYSNGTPKCICCGETEIYFLTIDHINNNGNIERNKLYGKNKGSGGSVFYYWLKKNNYPDGYQVMCSNCNTGKSRNNGVCPHKGAEEW